MGIQQFDSIQLSSILRSFGHADYDVANRNYRATLRIGGSTVPGVSCVASSRRSALDGLFRAVKCWVELNEFHTIDDVRHSAETRARRR
jgi:hypothetical protein